MTGYQEILTILPLSRQIVTLTYPHIGNVEPMKPMKNLLWFRV